MPDRQGSVADRIVGHRRGKHSTCSPVSTMVKGVRIQRLSAKPEFWLASDSVPCGPVCSSQSAPSLQDGLCCFRNTWRPMSHGASLGVLLRSASVRACLFLLQPAVAVMRAQLLRPAVRPRLLEQVVQSHLCARILYLRVRVQASVQACQRASTLAGKLASVQACERAGEPASQHFRKKASHRTQPASQPASKQASKPAGQRTVTQASHPASALPISSAQQGHEQAGQQASRKASERAGRKASQQANQQASQQANQQASQPARDGASSHV